MGTLLMIGVLASVLFKLCGPVGIILLGVVLLVGKSSN